VTRDIAPPEEVVAPTQSIVAGGAASALTFWAAAVFAVTLGFSRLSYGLLLPALRHTFGGELASYGLIGTVNFVGYLLGTLLVPPLLGRLHNRTQLNVWSCLLLGLSMIGSALSWSLLSLSVWRFWVGLISAPATVLTVALALERVRPAGRGLASGIVWARSASLPRGCLHRWC
jgi:predicted MFS family arabinose efflux permease